MVENLGSGRIFIYAHGIFMVKNSIAINMVIVNQLSSLFLFAMIKTSKLQSLSTLGLHSLLTNIIKMP